MTGTGAETGAKPDEANLVALLKAALALADELGLTAVGLRLDQALIELTGQGLAPNMNDIAGEDAAAQTGFHSPGAGNGESARLR
uniref:hypothetical protein n=1 Tax=Sphingomonas bacterium TaxID=1895847 RepID=UPI00261A3144|nr:hypothetical protein [Sphingomonas bacterium]